jgi:hypothetical protein
MILETYHSMSNLTAAYLTTLSQCTENIMYRKQRGSGFDIVESTIPVHCLESTRKITETFTQNNEFSGRDSNLELPEHKSETLPLEVTSSIT